MTLSSFSRVAVGAGLTIALAAACAPTPERAHTEATDTARAIAGTPLVLRDTTIAASFDAAGVAEPYQQATLATKLMGTVTRVLVHEGDRVVAGQLLFEIDARDLAARASQVAAAIADADAQRQDAQTQATRFRALYADSAATRAQLDAAETGLARADAGVRAARAGASEVEVLRTYAGVRAPFAGQVAARLVDPGALSAPGMPMLIVQDVSRLRLTASVPADVAQRVARGDVLAARGDGFTTTARVEGIVPAGAGNLSTINAIVTDAPAALRAGSAIVLAVTHGTRAALLVPRSALVFDGDLVGVVVRRGGRDDRRWVRIGDGTPTLVEVTSGLAAGDTIVVPTSTPKV